MEVFQEVKNELKQAITKLAHAPINTSNIDRVLYKLHALKDELKMVDYQIEDIIVEAETPLQYNEHVLSNVPPSHREPYPLVTPCYSPPRKHKFLLNVGEKQN